MRGFALAAALLTLSAGGAALADGPLPKRSPVYAPTAYNWTGCYLGGHVGGLTGTTQWSDPLGNFGPFLNNTDIDFTSATYGGHAGCNAQFGQVVIGLEGDWSWASVNEFFLNDLAAMDAGFRSRFDSYGSLRGRLGYAFDRWLVYGTGGWAFSKIRAGGELYADPSLTVLIDDTLRTTIRSGWTAGGGVEFALTNNIIIRGEYLYYDFGKHLVADFGGGDQEFAEPSFHVARVGISYKFGMDRTVAPLK